MLEESLASLRKQTFKNFEIIIVDDNSTDGSEKFIKNLMQEDTRISCIKHKENIGLPAISVLEAFLKANGQYIFFGFDDCVYNKNALKYFV